MWKARDMERGGAEIGIGKWKSKKARKEKGPKRAPPPWLESCPVARLLEYSNAGSRVIIHPLFLSGLRYYFLKW